MNAIETMILDRALNFMKAKAAEASENGMNVDEWNTASKNRAIEDMEILKLLSDAGGSRTMDIEVPRI